MHYNAIIKSGDKMRTRYLNAFLTIYQCRSYSKAAQKLYMTQPALTKQIKRLEDDLGFPLFVRDFSKGISLTEEGEVFLKYALQIVSLSEEAIKECKSIANKTKNTVTIGCDIYDTEALSADFLKYVNDKISHLTIKMVLDASGSTLELLERTGIDLYITGDVRQQNADFEYYELDKIPYIVVMDKSNPLSKKEYLTIEDLNHHYVSFAQPGYSEINDKITQEIIKNNPSIKLVQPYSHIIYSEANNPDVLYITIKTASKHLLDFACVPLKCEYFCPLWLTTKKKHKPITEQFIKAALEYYQNKQ